jgi:hypothetical protein
MLKTAALVAVPGALGGLGLLYESEAGPPGSLQYPAMHLVEVGVAFDEADVRALLPEGLIPVTGFTGGLALYTSDHPASGHMSAGGYLWIDVDYRGTARYVVRSFAATDPSGETPTLIKATPDESAPDLLQALAGSEEIGGLELSVGSALNSCRTGPAEVSPQVFASGPDGSLRVAPTPIIAAWCQADARSVRVMPGTEHALPGLEPERVLWAMVATPLGTPLPLLLAE